MCLFLILIKLMARQVKEGMKDTFSLLIKLKLVLRPHNDLCDLTMIKSLEIPCIVVQLFVKLHRLLKCHKRIVSTNHVHVFPFG